MSCVVTIIKHVKKIGILDIVCKHLLFFQELVKLTIMDLVMTVISTIVTDFLRAVFVRYANQCWCWDLEKGFVSIVVSILIYMPGVLQRLVKKKNAIIIKKDIKTCRDVVCSLIFIVIRDFV